MAIFYVDYVNGNDANNGSSWAQAFQTVKNGATSARIAAGDEIRIAKTPDPTVMTNQCGWGNGLHYVTADGIGDGTSTTGKIYKIGTDGSATGWTAVSATGLGTTAMHRGTSTSSLSFTLSTTPGATQVYYNTGTIDLSGFNTLVWWLRLQTTAFDGRTTNNPPQILFWDGVNGTGNILKTLNVPKHHIPNGMWTPVTMTDGTALPSGVQSITFVTPTSLTAQVLLLDHLFAIHDEFVPSLSSVFSAYDSTVPEYLGWYAPYKYEWNAGTSKWRIWINSRGAGDSAASAPTASTANTITQFTGSYVTHIRKSVNCPPSILANTQTGVNEGTTESNASAATDGLTYTISGGWNTSNTVKDGETWTYHFRNNVGYCFVFTHVGWRLKDCSFIGGGGAGIQVASGSDPFEINNVSLVSGGWGVVLAGSLSYPKIGSEPVIHKFHSITQSIVAVNTTPVGWSVTGNLRDDPYGEYGYTFEATNISVNLQTGNQPTDFQMNGRSMFKVKYFDPAIINFRFNEVDVMLHSCPTNASLAAWSNTSWVLEAGTLSQYNVNSPGVFTGPGVSTSSLIRLIGSEVVVDMRNWNSISMFPSKTQGVIHFNNTTIPNTTEINAVATFYANAADQRSYLTFKDFDQTAGYHKVAWPCSPGSVSIMDTVVTPVRTGSTAWRIFPTGGNSTGDGVLRNYPLAKAYVVASKLVTVTIYTRKNNTMTSARMILSVHPWASPTVVTQYSAADIKASSTDAWEQKTFTFTPVGSGYVTVYLNFKGEGTAGQYLYWDDLTITQAD